MDDPARVYKLLEAMAWDGGQEPAVAELSAAVAAVPLTLVPYHLWGNRGPATMRVWLPETPQGKEPP